MNVFVLCTGRTGSVTFNSACSFIDNFTSGHESRVKLTGDDRLNFPDQHIEVDNRLIWFFGQLDERYGKEAFYVHLVRDPKKVANSFNQRWQNPHSIINAYSHAILFRKNKKLNEGEKLNICRDFVENTNKNIEVFLRDKPHKMIIDIDRAVKEFPIFWKKINATGNLESALNVFAVKLNSQKEIEITHKKNRRWWHRFKG